VEDKMKVVCLADTHCEHRKLEVPDGDILICAGDFTHTGRTKSVLDFVQWFSSLPHKYKILVAGNHDLTLDESFYLDKRKVRKFHRKPCDLEVVRKVVKQNEKFFYLHHDWVEVNGLKIFGSPYVPTITSSSREWAFERSEETLTRLYSSIPSDIDILVSHTPAFGILDEYNSVQFGSWALRHAVARIKPKALVCGHIHSGYGQQYVNGTLHVNCAQVDGDNYEIIRSPQTFELRGT
jgi:Icc-related predicted phosphoesterase